MRKVIGAVFVSLDGVVQAPGGPDEDRTGGFEKGGWVFPYGDDQTFETVGELFAGPFDLLLGRRTYEIFAAYWPNFPDDERVGGPFNRCTKYVMTHGPQELTWQNSVRVTSLEDLARIKQGEGPDLIIQGSSTLYPQLLGANLIDEMRLMTFPIILGKGKRLFAEGSPATELQMLRSTVSPNGVVIASYRPSGDVKHGSFAMPHPTELELERREKVRRGVW